MNKFFLFFTGVWCFVNTAYGQPATPIWLDDLAIKSFSEGIPAVLPKVTAAGVPMRMKGRLFERGVGVNATSVLAFFLAGNAREFSAVVGVDDSGQRDLPHTFYVIGDEKILFTSGAMRLGDEPKSVKVDVTGIQRLGLLVLVDDIGRTKLYSNWADAQLLMIGQHQPQQIPNTDEKYILTPLPAPKPKINSASIFGATPGNPFLYTIAATGNRPMQFSATNLPKGLTIDAKTGIISGKVTQRGTYVATLKAKNALGEASKKLTIKIGDTIALTPPIGWNGWNSWAKLIDREKVVASARAMVNMGLSQHGWTYINIDDAWQGPRGGAYNAIMPNEKFPNFKEMVDEIHGLGLKVGVYSTPWITSYAGYPGGSSYFENGAFPDSIRANHRAHRLIGKYRFETADARQMADWGIDFLKYDWRLEVPSAERMATALRQSGRDIVYSISNSAPFAQVNDWVRLTNTFRTGPDIRDSWTSLYRSAFTLDKWAPYGGPGHWLDPDMMILGNVTTGSQLHPTRLTPDEQYSHVSIFSLLSAPLLIGCPIEQLDAFTLNLLTNDEVIAINQDPLGKSARLLVEENGVQIWVKPLEDGSVAVGLFNVADFGKTPQSYFRWGNEKPRDYSLDLAKIGLTGKYKLRDVWRQKDLGVFTGSFQTAIRHHGVVMLRMSPQ
ncbi:NPCBM/NEW2 domain-containing protein [Larkinella bovis]|uniref:Alpha-galactosidase n=1 Tax=Larkinella bovis TaxID=683041 RepID=A0ABW0IEZ4_9BACT